MLLPGASASISCAEPGTSDPSETDQTPSAGTDAASEAETADPAFADDLPALDFKNETISIFASRRPGAEDELYAEGINHELINDAVYERNMIVEDKLNVRLDIEVDTDSGSHYSVANTIHNLVMTGTDDYQICTGPAYVTVIFCVKGDYLDLPSFEYLNLDKHYWSQGFNEMASWGDGHQYTASGSVALSLFRNMYITLYNKDLLKDWQAEDPFDSVLNGTWTLDYQTQLTTGMYRDLNGNGISDRDDAYGFISGAYGSSDCYWIACDTAVVKKDEDGLFVYDADVDRIFEAVEDVLALYYRADSLIIPTAEDDPTLADNVIGPFSENRAFMITTMVIRLENSLRDYKGEYGLLPIPKLDAAQDGYRTCVQDQVTCLAVPVTCPDGKQDMVGAVLECLASESYKTVADAYYNTALSYRYINNPESKVMLDLIYDSVSFEIAQIYTDCIGSFLNDMRSIVESRNNTTVSSFKRIKRTMEKSVREVNQQYAKVSGS